MAKLSSVLAALFFAASPLSAVLVYESALGTPNSFNGIAFGIVPQVPISIQSFAIEHFGNSARGQFAIHYRTGTVDSSNVHDVGAWTLVDTFTLASDVSSSTRLVFDLTSPLVLADAGQNYAIRIHTDGGGTVSYRSYSGGPYVNSDLLLSAGIGFAATGGSFPFFTGSIILTRAFWGSISYELGTSSTGSTGGGPTASQNRAAQAAAVAAKAAQQQLLRQQQRR